MEWITLNEDLLHEAFQDKECNDLLALRIPADPVPGLCRGIAARIRTAILSNGRGGLQGGACDIPQSLRGVAVALLRMAVLIRYNINVSEDRRTDYREAEARLSAIEKGDIPFASQAVATRPTYSAPTPAYRRAAGMLPGAHRYPSTFAD